MIRPPRRAPGASARRLRLARAVTLATRRLRATTAGRWRVELHIRGRSVRRSFTVGTGASTAPPPTVLATGDSLMQGIDSLLADELGETATVRSDVHPGTGISRPRTPWTQLPRSQTKRLRQAATVISIGAVDGFPMPAPDGTTHDCCGAGWIAEYSRRARSIMRTYRRRGRARVIWLTIPVPRGPRLVADAVNLAVVRAAEGLDRVSVLRLDLLFRPTGTAMSCVTAAATCACACANRTASTSTSRAPRSRPRSWRLRCETAEWGARRKRGLLKKRARCAEIWVILLAVTCRRPLAGLLCTLLASLALPAGAHADPGPYVALGDSYTAAPLVLTPVGQPIGCARSDHNYPSLVATATGVTQFHDAGCSGATTEHMTAPQPVLLGMHSPQFDALRPDTALVTIGIGGNDVGLVGAAVTCVGLGLLSPTGTACRTSYAKPDGGDRLVDQIAATAPKIAATLQGVHARSPQARVLIVGYPNVAPRDGKGCYPLVPLSNDDVTYLDEMVRRTNAMLVEQAAANDAEYVDTYDESVGHDMCKGPRTRWFEGLLPTAPAAPIHPNALGEASMARSVLRVLLGSPPVPLLSDLRRSRRAYAAGSAAQFAYRLDRPATMTFTLQRALAGRSVAGSCAAPTKVNRGGRSCRRWSGVLHTFSQSGRGGDNTVEIGSAVLGRRAGLVRLTATASRGAGQPSSAPQHIYFRVTRMR